jgi:hypothetical protein
LNAAVRRIATAPAILLIVTGCALPHPSTHPFTSAYRAQNVFTWGSSLPAQVRRVAVLPMACDQGTAEMVDGRDALEPIMQVELSKLRRFELITLTQETLQARTGRTAWSCEETLPHDFFPWLAESYACDAVLFCRLTVFRGYAPLAVGWRIRLVDVHTHTTLWAGDEVFDAGLPAVQAGARQFQLAGLRTGALAPDEWAIENSPRQFGQYAAAQLLTTLTGR